MPRDFNADANSDILWRNDNGAVAIWEMNGLAKSGGAVVGSAPTSWHIEATGDFNGDGKSDILWQNDNGAVAIWEMNGLTRGTGAVAGVPTSWHIAPPDTTGAIVGASTV